MIADEPTFARLMSATQAGDKAAADMLLSDAGLWLERYYLERLPLHQVDGLVQQALITVYTKRGSWDPMHPFLPWLTAIAQYRWVDHLRVGYKQSSKQLLRNRTSCHAQRNVTAI